MYASDIFKFVLFSDDTNIVLSSKNYNCIVNTMNTERNNVHDWLCTNKLSINLSKLYDFQ